MQSTFLWNGDTDVEDEGITLMQNAAIPKEWPCHKASGSMALREGNPLDGRVGRQSPENRVTHPVSDTTHSRD